MINSVSNSFINNAPVLNENSIPTDRQAAISVPKEIVNKIDGNLLTIKNQVKDMAASGPPISKDLAQIKNKIDQGIYPIDLGKVTEKIFESFQEAF
jgi:anti-sigma28 factor (negative regulator of flagellin synthesis)